MAIQSITKPMALDETLQSTNTALGGVAKDTTLQSTNGKMDSVITKLQGIIDALGIKTSVYKAGGDKTCAELVPALLIEDYCGYVYNITDTGTTTSDFVEGAGKPINIGDNVGIVDRGTGGNHVYKFDLMAGMVDLTDYIKKSSTSGFVKNDGTIDTTTYQPTEAGKGLSSNDYTSAEKTKLAGIATGATKTEPSTTNGNIKIDGTETQVYNDAEIQGKLSTATTSSTGNPINFTTKSAQNAVSTIIDLEPIQDLHGYDKPWVGGAGKNKLPMTVALIKALNTDGTWTGNSYVVNNVTFTIIVDSDNNVTGIKVNGTANARTLFVTAPYFTDFLTNGVSYTINGNASGYSTDTAFLQIVKAPASGQYNVDDSYTFTYDSATQSDFKLCIRVDSGKQASNLIFYPMIRLSTETDPTFAPYSNLCPISGRSEIGIGGCGKNKLPLTVSGIKALNTSGSWSGNVYTIGNLTVTLNTDADNNIIGIKLNGSHTSNIWFVLANTFALSAGGYNFNGIPSTASSSISMRLKDMNDSSVNILQIFRNDDLSATLSSSLTNLRVDIQIPANTSSSNVILYPMIRLSTETDPTFEPYTKSNDITIQFGETVYGCHVNVEKSVLTVDRGIVDLGDYTYTYSSDWGGYPAFFCTSALPNGKAPNASANPNAICSDYQGLSRDYLVAHGDTAFCIPTDKKVIIRDSRYSDATIFKTALSGVQLCYELETPITIQLTPHQISLLKGVNNISVSDDYSEITLTYRSGEVATLGDLLDTENKMLAKQHNYSTDEQVVGTSDDGRPLYEKTLNLNATQIADNNYSDSDIEYADQFNIVSGYYVISGAYGNISLGLNSYESSSLYTRTGFRMYNKTLFTVTNGYTAVSAKIIIQYTKST